MSDQPHRTSTDLLVLHALRCIGFSGPSRVAEVARLPEDDVESELIDLARAGLVTHTTGPFGGWGLTEAGKAADTARITDELQTTGGRTAVTEAYQAFLVLNPELLDLCTAWQMRTVDGVAVTNDHTDPDYDARVLDQLTHFDQRADLVCAALSSAMQRFQPYRVRLSHALTRARSGSLEYVTDDMASYHSVWFQLHEDLLTTLGIPRYAPA